MTITAPGPDAAVLPGARCRYPGCVNLARVQDDGVPGRRPGYCGQDVPEDAGGGITALVRHSALTAFRRRSQLAGQPDPGGRPVTAAISRAAAVRDDAVAAMTRLAGQLTAVLDQLAVLGEQLAAAADPGAAEAQAEAVRAEAAAAIEQARAEAASQSAARHAAGLDAAEARAAAAEAITAMHGEQQARQHAQDTAAALQDQLGTAIAEAQAARAAAARQHEEDQQRHTAGHASATARLAAADEAITALRDQLTRAETALERERARQHETTALLHDLITSRPAAASGGPAPGSTTASTSRAGTARTR